MTVEAQDGEEALEAAAGGELAALILDVDMPRLRNYEVCARVRREQGDRLPILFVSDQRTELIDRVAG